MNIQQAQKLSLHGLISGMGIEIEKAGKRYKCKSPFRPNEIDASFYLMFNQQKNKWQWKDFGLNGKGGDIIDFMMDLHQTNETGALLMLESPEISINRLSFIGKAQSTHENLITIKKIKPLENSALTNYLNSRKISYHKAVNYIQECYYIVSQEQQKPYFALCWKNDNNGYELRTASTKKKPEGRKLTVTPKTITTIHNTNKLTLNIFEAMIDFVSALEFFKTNKPACTTIVLNSLSNLQHVISILKNYEKINLFLDNDTAGNEAAETIKKAHPRVTDYSKIIYPNCKDMNDYLLTI